MWKRSLLATAVALAFAQSSAQAKDVLDLTSLGAQESRTASIGGDFIVQQIVPQPTGTGFIDSFLRIQQTGQERGYNTSLGTPLDDKSPAGGFTRAITLGEIPIVNIGGVDYRQILLDINQNVQERLSLNQIQIFQGNADAGTAGTLGEASASGDAILDGSSLAGSANEVFRLNNAQNNGTDVGANREIWLDFSLGSGSGSGDMFLYVRNDQFTQNDSSNITLFSQFGNPSGTYSSNDGFEEWAVLKGTPTPQAVPEPATTGVALSGLITLGIVGRLRRRRQPEVTKD